LHHDVLTSLSELSNPRNVAIPQADDHCATPPGGRSAFGYEIWPTTRPPPELSPTKTAYVVAMTEPAG
jgi:hypothetical protein